MMLLYDVIHSERPVWLVHKQTKTLCGWALYDGEVSGMIRFKTFSCGAAMLLAGSKYGEYWECLTEKPKDES